MTLSAVASLFVIAASLTTVITFLGPVLRAVVHFEDLYHRLIPDDGSPCIISRMEAVEADVEEIRKIVHPKVLTPEPHPDDPVVSE